MTALSQAAPAVRGELRLDFVLDDDVYGVQKNKKRRLASKPKTNRIRRNTEVDR